MPDTAYLTLALIPFAVGCYVLSRLIARHESSLYTKRDETVLRDETVMRDQWTEERQKDLQAQQIHEQFSPHALSFAKPAAKGWQRDHATVTPIAKGKAS